MSYQWNLTLVILIQVLNVLVYVIMVLDIIPKLINSLVTYCCLYEAVDKQIEDCKKAIWYINRHIESLSKSVPKPLTNKQKVDLLNTIMKPGQVKAGGAWMLDREAAARAAIAEVQEPKTWLDCDD